MKLQTVRGTYEGLTGTASDNTRKLNFAGIAVVWIFRVESTHLLGIQSLAFPLLVALALFVFSLGADLLHYLYGSAIWAAAHSILETAKVSEDAEFKVPAWMNWPTWTLFWLKVLLCISAYLCVCGYISFRVIERFAQSTAQ